MNESIPIQESLPEISRNEALVAYKKFVDRGITNPDMLDLANPEVIEANNLFNKWCEQEEKKAGGNIDAGQRINFEMTMFYVDAGFMDPAYLSEILGWLAEDGMSVERSLDNENKKGLREDIANAIKKIRNILNVSIENNIEHIPTKDEVMEVIAQFVENPTFVRELSDEQGIYLLEVKIENKESGESVEYRYTRKGTFPNKIASAETIIHRVYYEGDMPVGGDNVAEYKSETRKWEIVK